MAKSGFFRSVVGAIVESRSRHAERYVETHGYRSLMNEKRSSDKF